MFYRKVYPGAWHVIKDSPYLLFFGLFASLLGFHEVKLIFTLTESTPDFLSSTFNFWVQLFTTFATVKIDSANLPALLGLIVIFLILSALVILAVASQGALIKASADKTTRTRNKFTDYLHLGVDKFWPLFGLHLINIFIGYFFVASVINPLISLVAVSGSLFEYLILSLVVFFILFPLVLILSFVTRYGMAFIMIKNQKFLAAFTNSWSLFKINWLITIENAVVVAVVTLLFLVAMAAGMVFVFVPFFFLSVFLAGVSTVLYTVIILLGSLAALLIMLTASALYGAFYNILWAKVWSELATGGRSYSKVYRLGQKHLAFSRR
ncbi:MAG: hypothetical protein C3F02_01220 [Parcubacteria group bacterium]|nr:MAG: hypothetical protein C3F02_01220 [Parcubacteria group bacterium]